jgi:multiple sugar transport system substrate-binding protein
MSDLTRRGFLGGAAIGATFLPLGGGAFAQGQRGPLNVFAHRVHQTVSTGSQGGDIAKAWAEANGVAVQWATFDTGPLQERLFREASLGETSVDVGFLLNTQAVPRATTLFEPLDEYLQRDPIEDWNDVFEGLRDGMRVGGRLVAVPFRHASSGLHYNEAILAERGFTKPPATIEELIEMAKACTFRRPDGTPVVGFLTPGLTYPNVIDVARAWDGDFVTRDFKCAAEGPGMMNAIDMFRSLFQAGAFPRNFASINTEEVNVWMQQGRAAFCLNSMGRNRIYNDPEKSRFPGRIKTIAVPASASLRGKYEVAPAKVEFWGLAIPRNARRKDLSWSFIKAMLTKQSTLAAALNGNGPVRNSTYDDPKFASTVPYAEEERRVLKVGRVPLPAFDEATRAGDYFKEEAEAAVLGMKSAQDAMASLCKRVTPLLPS